MTDAMRKLIDETRRLDREATPGPWLFDPMKCWLPGFNGATPITGAQEGVFHGNGSGTVCVTGPAEDCQSMNDSALIATYRTAAPVLAAEVERLDARLAEVERERDEDLLTLAAKVRRLQAEVQQRIAHGNALYDAIVARLAPHFPPSSRDLEWDVLPGTLAKLARGRDELRALWTAEQQEHRQTARECGDARQDALALRSELEEAHLTLAAEQGRQEGAPSEGWESCYGMLDRWRKNAGRDNFGNTVWLFAERINTASNSTTNRWRISRVLTRGGPAPNSGSTPEGFYRTARAAMLTADAATTPLGPAPRPS